MTMKMTTNRGLFEGNGYTFFSWLGILLIFGLTVFFLIMLALF